MLEGLLTTLLGEKNIIQRLLESESNQENEYDKYNRVDMLAEDSKGELILIEVQNNSEYAYFQRMLFGTSKLVTEYINRGESYDKVRKVYSVNIVYFSLGHGRDFIFEKVSALIRWRVLSVSGTCRLMMSLSLKRVSRSTCSTLHISINL